MPMQTEGPSIDGWNPPGVLPRKDPADVARLNRHYHLNDSCILPAQAADTAHEHHRRIQNLELPTKTQKDSTSKAK